MDSGVGENKNQRNEHDLCKSKFCDICKEGNNNEEAVGFCTNCCQYLCDLCKQYHHHVAKTKTHTIFALDSMPKAEPESEESKFSDEIKPQLCKVHDLDLQFYCEKHDAAICKTCNKVEHRKCKSIELVRKADCLKSNECTDLLEYTKFIEKRFEKVKNAKYIEKSEFVAEKSKIIKAILEKRKEYDRLEQKALQEVEDIFKTEVNIIEKETEVIEQSQPLISATIKKLENSINLDAVEKFLAVKSVSDEVKKYEEIFQDTKSISKRKICFASNGELSRMDCLGKTLMTKEDIDVDMDFNNVLDPKQLSDKVESDIEYLDILSDGRHLLLDMANVKLKLFSANKVFSSEFTFQDKITSMTVLNDNKIMVTIPQRGDRSLQTIEIEGETMRLGHCIPTKLCNGLVTKYSDTKLLTLSIRKSGQFYIQIIDLNGNVTQKSKIENKLVKQPFYIGHYSNKSTDLVYIVDGNNGCIFMTLDGKITSHYKDDIYDKYGGLAIDNEGCVYIGCGHSKSNLGNLMKISPNGETMKFIFSKNHKHLVMPLHCLGNKMFVFTAIESASCVAFIYNQLV